MTREEAIQELEILKEDYWDDDGYGHETKQYDDTMLALDMAIKALEKEPILNKLRAEIETKYGQCKLCEFDSDYDGVYTDIGDIADILQILDKYKAENEANNGKA